MDLSLKFYLLSWHGTSPQTPFLYLLHLQKSLKASLIHSFSLSSFILALSSSFFIPLELEPQISFLGVISKLFFALTTSKSKVLLTSVEDLLAHK